MLPVRRYLTLLLLVLSLGLALRPLSQPLLAETPPGAIARGTGGAVASVDERATQIGIDILKAGGNAVDAAVATAAALGVTEPFSAGIGGGGFMLIYRKAENQVITLDGREQAPATASVDMFKNPDDPAGGVLPFSPNRISSGVAVGVPGTLNTWVEALNRYGTLTLEQAMAPAIALAETGFKIDSTFADQVRQNQARFEAFTSTKNLYLPEGKPPEVGSIFTNPDLAHTYRLLATQGLNGLHQGAIGEAIVNAVQHPPTVVDPPFHVLPGGMTMIDLDEYDLHIRPAVSASYRGYKIYGIGLPSSGGITSLQVLKTLEGFDLAGSDRTKALHTLIEAERLAFADRSAYLGDPEYVDVPLPGLLSSAYAQTRRASIPDHAPTGEKDFRASAGNPLPFQNDPSPSLTASSPVAQTNNPEGLSTTHLTVSDRLGNIVSYTLTLESTGGSGIVVPGYGFLLNNELTDFDPVSPHPNSPEPRKRPRSSIDPLIAFAPNGSVIAYGSPGGSTIITTVLGITVNLIDFGMSLDEAIAAPRISQRNSGTTQVDSRFEQSSVGQSLTTLGHVLEPIPEIGAATGILLNPDGTTLAAAEPVRRGSGSAMTVTPGHTNPTI